MRRARLAASTLALFAFGGCVSTRLEPAADGWAVDDGGEVAWRERDAEVVGFTRSGGVVGGRIVNRGRAALRFRFVDVRPASAQPQGQRGEISGRPPSYGESWTRPLEVGLWFDLPGAPAERSSIVSFTLTPVVTQGSPKETIETIRYDVQIQSSGWSTTCPFHFDVRRTEPGTGGKILLGIGALLGLALLAAAAFVGVVLAVFAAFSAS